MAELALLLHGCREAFLRITHDHHWRPAAGSIAAADLAAYVNFCRDGSPNPQIHTIPPSAAKRRSVSTAPHARGSRTTISVHSAIHCTQVDQHTQDR